MLRAEWAGNDRSVEELPSLGREGLDRRGELGGVLAIEGCGEGGFVNCGARRDHGFSRSLMVCTLRSSRG